MNDAEEVKKRIDIVEFIGQYLQLKKAGINYSACCPFHDEKTPSFMVSSQRQSFKCFGCSKSGDVISFFMEMEGLNFPEALKILGERVGIQISTKPKEIADKEKAIKDKIFAINLVAAKYYKSIFWSDQGKSARAYLAKRGISDELVEKFKLGFASSSNRLDDYFAKYSFSNKDISLAGNPQRFKYRIIFPIFDVLGGVVGFSGRILEEVLPKSMSPHPKYLNSPQTPIFNKSRCLYGLNLAKDAIRKNDRVIVVEGQMDVISSHLAGVSEVVASSGTALTQDHLKILKRYTNNVIFAFDEDEAGQKAAYSAVLMAVKEDIDVKLTTIEKYKDVGELVEKQSNLWGEVVSRALPPIEWLCKKYQDKIAKPEGKKALASLALPVIAVIASEVEKSHYVSYLARFLGVPAPSIEKSLDKIEKKTGNTAREEEPATKQTEKERDLYLDVFAFIVSCANNVQISDLPPEDFFADTAFLRFYKDAQKCYNLKQDAKGCLNKLIKSLPEDLGRLVRVAALEWDKKTSEDSQGAICEFKDIVKKIKSKNREFLKDEFAQKIGAAEARGDMQEVRDLMIKLQNKLKEE